MAKFWTKSKILLVAFFGLFLIIGLIALPSYGISWDEPVERETSLTNLKHIYLTFTGSAPAALDEYVPIDEYHARYYGVALQLIPSAVEAISGFTLTSPQIYFVRHLFTFLLFFGASICLYLVGRQLWAKKNRLWALLPVIFMILSPRIFAESFYNIKDIVFLSIFIINFYLGLYWRQKTNSWPRLIAFSVISALCINTRVIGLVIPLIFVGINILEKIITYFTAKKSARKFDFWSIIWQPLIMVTITSISLIVFSPASWSSPLYYFAKVLKTFAAYPWEGEMLYWGQIIDSTALPWHYLPVWITITTPVLYLILFLVGIGAQIKTWLKSKKFTTFLFDPRLLVYGLAVGPIVLFMLVKPIIYDSWRHFYFIYPLMLLVAVDGLLFLWELKKVQHWRWLQILLITIVTVNEILVGGWMVKNHPHQYVYFAWPWRDWAAHNFTRDYWNLSYKEQLAAIEAQEEVFPTTVKSTCYGIEQNLLALDPEDQTKFMLTESPKYYIHSSRDQIGDDWVIPFHHHLSDLAVDNFKISGLYLYDFWDVRFYEPSDFGERVELYPPQAQQVDPAENAVWLTFEVQAGDSGYDLLRFADVFSPNRVSEPVVYVSTDGRDWQLAQGLWVNGSDYMINTADYQYLSLKIPNPLDSTQNSDQFWDGDRIQSLTLGRSSQSENATKAQAEFTQRLGRL